MTALHKALLIVLCAGGCQRSDPPSGTSASGAPGTAQAPGAVSGPPEPAADVLPVLRVDDRHSAMRDGGVAYTIVAAPGLILDATGHRFEPTPFGKEPTSVHLMHGADEYYRADWSGRAPLTVDATALSPIRGRGRFAGFAAGEKYIVAIGVEGEQSADGAMRFSPMWIAHVEVN